MASVSVTGVLLGLLLVLDVTFNAAFCVLPAAMLVFISPKLSRILVETLGLASWSGFVAGFLELIYGIKIVITGDISKNFSKTRPTLIIMNHRCRFDWLFLWCLILRLGALRRERIILKSGLRKLPIIGWAMDASMYVMLNRNWSDDEKAFTNVIRYYRKVSLPVQLLLFPEGTDFSPKNKAKDLEFAKKNDLRINEYVMHPRTKGFYQCVKILREQDQFDICDITVGYVGKIMQGEMDMIKGDFPSEVHFNVNMYSNNDIAGLDEEGLGQWIKQKWAEKEAKLKEFYQNESFGSNRYKDTWVVKAKQLGFLLLSVVHGSVFMYYLPWTIVFAAVVTLITFGVIRTKNGWSTVTLERVGEV